MVKSCDKKKKKGGGGTVTKETNYKKSLHSRKTQNLRKNIEKKLNPDEAKPWKSRYSKERSKRKKWRKQTLIHLESDEKTARDEELRTTEVIGDLVAELPICLQLIE